MDVRMPDGTIITNVPEDITQDELLARYQAYNPTPEPDDAANFKLASEKPLFGEESKVTRNPIEAFKSSFYGLGESGRQAVETPIYGATEAFERSQERRKEITEKPGFSLEQIQGEFERGTIPGLVETAKQIPSGFGAYLGYAFPSLVAYSGAPLIGIKGTLGRMFAAGTTSLLPMFGENMTRQAEGQLERGEPIDIDVAKALYTSAGQAALDVIPIDRILGPLVTPKKLKDAEKIIKSKPNKTLEAVTEGLLTAELEAGTEITQQLLERWQAGLPLFDQDAIKEYKEVGALSLFAGPLGAYSGYKNVQSAEDYIKNEEQRVERIKKINAQRDKDEFNKLQAMRGDLMDRWQNRKDPEEEDTFEQLKNMTTESIAGVNISLPVKSKLLQQLKKYEADYNKAEAKEKEKIAKQAIDELTNIPEDFVKTLDLSPLRLIDKKLIRDLGVAPNSAAARNILGLDPTNPAHVEKITAILKNYLDNLVTSPTANAERAQKAEVEIGNYLNTIGATENVEIPIGTTGAEGEPETKEIQDGRFAEPTEPGQTIGEGPRTGISIPGESLRDLPAAELATSDRFGITGAPSYVRELEGRIEQQRTTLKDLQKQERGLKSESKLTQPTLKQFLSKPENRIAKADMLDILGETKTPRGTPGYFRAFSSNPKAEDLMTRIENGRLDSYLPEELKSTYEDPATGLGFDSRAAYDYVAEAMRADEEVLHMEDQATAGAAQEQLSGLRYKQDELQNLINQDEQDLKVERANEDLVGLDRERRDIRPMESRQRATQTIETYNWEKRPVSETEKSLINEAKTFFKNKLRPDRSNEYWNREGNFLFGNQNRLNAYWNWEENFQNKVKKSNSNIHPQSLIRAGYALARQELGDFKVQLDPVWNAAPLQESRQAQITEETPASIIDAMKKVFGENVAKGIKSGLINIVPSIDALPKALQRQLSPTARAAFLGDKAYFIANRITREAAPQMLLHEIGAHYGLERMLGKNYKNIVTNLINNKNKDKQIKRAFEDTVQYYPDLDVNSPDFIQEVIANLGERAPKNTLFQRIMNLIRNFLTRLGYGWNTKNLSARDIANMVQLSTIQSLKNEGRYKTSRHSSLALASDENVEAPMFYSALKRAVINAKQDKMPPKEWASWLKGNAPKLGIKQAELDATGILDILNGNLMPTYPTPSLLEAEAAFGVDTAMEQSKLLDQALASSSMTKADLLNIINNQAIELGETIYGAGAVDELDAPDRETYVEGIVEEWRAEKENGLEDSLWEVVYDNYDPYYFTRSITKEQLELGGQIVPSIITELATAQLDAKAIPYTTEDLNNLREEITDQLNKEGEIFYVSSQDGINSTFDEGKIYLNEDEAYEVVDEYDRPYIDEYHDSLVNEARRELDREEEGVRQDAENMYDDEYGDGQTKYKQYTLPGGDNYTELLITNPNAITLFPGPEGQRTAAKFRSSHFDRDNIVVHIRMTGRTSPETGKSVLFVEEIQSDWGQQGRQRGFRRELTEDEKQQLKDLIKNREQLRKKLDDLNSKVDKYKKIASDIDKARDQSELKAPVSIQKLALMLDKALGLNIIQDNMYGKFIDMLAYIGALKGNLKLIDTLGSEVIQSYMDFPEGYNYMYNELRNLRQFRSDDGISTKGIVYNYIQRFLAEYEEEVVRIEGFVDKLSGIMSALKTPEFKNWLDEFEKYYIQSTEALAQAALLKRDAMPINHNYREITNQISNLEGKAEGYDSGPFVTDSKDWSELAIKRIARWAVDNNYDNVAFINGVQSSRRYSLATAFEEIAITRSEDGKTYTLAARERGTDDFSDARTIEKNVPENELAAYIGTELAEKAKKIDPGITDIFDTNLRGPNKGFEYFYDKLIPSVIKQVTKKIGGEPTKFNLSSIPEMQDDEIGEYIGMQTGFKVTPEMKKNIAGGMPLFSKQPKVLESRQRPEETRADGSPIKYYVDDRTRIQKALDAIKTSTPDSRKSAWKRFTDMLGVKIIGGRYTVERKAIDAGLPEISARQQGRVRGDLILLQAYNLVQLALSGLFRGRLKLSPSGLIIADESTGNTKVGILDVSQAWNDLLATATEELGSEAAAYDLLTTGWYGPRYQEIKRYNESVGEDEQINIDEWTESDQSTYEEAYRRYGNELRAIRDMRNIMRKDVLDFLVETGLYTREKAQDYLDKLEYVPLYRVPDDQIANYENAPFKQGRGMLGANKEYRLLGSDRAAADPIENFILNMSWLMQRGIKNNAVKATADLLQELGEGEYMTRPMTPGEQRALHHAQVNINGKPVTFVMDDPNDMAAFASTPVITNFFVDLINYPVRLLRRGITMMPEFVWNQATEDPIRATLVAGNKAGILKNIMNTWKSIAINQFRADLSPNADMLNRYGIIGQKDILDSQEIIDRYKGKNKNGLSKYLFFFERLSHGSDLGARESIYQEAIKELQAKGYDQQTAEDYAALKALQYLPYQQIGQSRTMAYLRRMMPFINPPIQGMFRELEAMRGRVGDMTKAEGKKAFLWRLGKYLAFTAMYTAFMSGDDDYENETDYNRDNNFFIGGVRFAVPRELAPFKVAIERGTRAYVLNYDRADLESPEVAGAIIRKFWELGAGFLPMPTFATPLLENATNFDLFTSRPLVSPSLARREPRYQFNDNTSEIAKVIGNYLNVSPIKIDNLLRGYLGYLGATLGEFTNYMASDRPDKRPSDLLFIGNIIQNEFGTGPRQRFYKLYDKVNEAAATVKFFEERGDAKGLKEYVDKNKGYLGIATYMNKINQELSEIRKARRYITGTDTISSTEKRAKLDKLEKIETKMLNSVIDKLDRTAMKYNK